MENMKLSDRFITAMFLPKEYGKLLKLKMNKMVSFIVCLILLVTVIQFAIPNLAAIAGMGGIKNIVLNVVPEFSLKDGVFHYDEKLEQKDEEMQTYVLIDTSVEAFTKDDVPENMIQAILVSKSNMLMFSSMGGLGTYQESKFSDLKSITVTNQSVANMAPFIYATLLFFFGIAYIFTMGKYLFMALIFAGMVFLFIRTVMPKFTFGKTYKTALFAQAIGVLVEAVSICIGTELFIMAGSAFNMIVTVVLMNRALMYIKLKESGVTLR